MEVVNLIRCIVSTYVNVTMYPSVQLILVNKNIKHWWLGGGAQETEQLPSKCQVLSLTPNSAPKI
jgi:hypothetical protein